jgi:hypothetical protein
MTDTNHSPTTDEHGQKNREPEREDTRDSEEIREKVRQMGMGVDAIPEWKRNLIATPTA